MLNARTDRAGRFSISNAPSGDIWLTARASRAASAPTHLLVRAGDRSEVELLVRPAAVLRTVLLDESGEPIRAAVRVQDDEGREYAGAASRDEIQQMMNEGVSANEREVGPLLPGTYVVSAVAADGRTGNETVVVGNDDVAVTLTLSD